MPSRRARAAFLPPAGHPFAPGPRRAPRRAAPSSCAASPQQAALAAALREEVPGIFGARGPDLALYAPDVAFRDPLNRFRGARRYAQNIAFLAASPVFSRPHIRLHDVWSPPCAALGAKPAVRTRWTLAMTANLPWRPRVVFTGTSDYVLDPATGLVAEHVDRWDSLDAAGNARFPSAAAVRDLAALCSWRAAVVPGGSGCGEFEVLRRARQYMLRRYSAVVAEERGGPRVERVGGGGGGGGFPDAWPLEVAAVRVDAKLQGAADAGAARDDVVAMVTREGAAVFRAAVPDAWVVTYPAPLAFQEVWVRFDEFCARAPTPE